MSHGPVTAIRQTGMVCDQCGGGTAHVSLLSGGGRSTNPSIDAPTVKQTFSDGRVILLHPKCRDYESSLFKL
jgi:hypothetical protein